MATDDPRLRPSEAKAATALRQAIQQLSTTRPVQLDVGTWVSTVPVAAPTWRRRTRLPVGLGVALAVVLAVGAVLVAQPGWIAAPWPASPRTHFDNGQFLFDYPSRWHDLSQGSGSIVLGDGTWCSGRPSSGCTSEEIDIANGRIVVRIWQQTGTAPAYCASPVPTGPTVQKYTEDSLHATQPTTRWEIRQPGYEFGMDGNVWIEAVTASESELAGAQSLVDSFRWDRDYCASPSDAPALPGRPGHYDDGSFSFDYPPEWSVISGPFYEGLASRTDAVIGTGVWHSGCRVVDNGGDCTGDTVDVSGGRVVVKILTMGGPAPDCAASEQPNATLGPNPVYQSTDGDAHTWEIAQPGGGLSWPNNVIVEAWTGDDAALSQAGALVASFRWAAGTQAWNACPSPTPLAHYDSDGISFDYPSTWDVISGYEHWGIHGPSILFAVGTGTVDSGCVVEPASGMFEGGVSCDSEATGRATGDQIVVYWYEGAHLFNPDPLPWTTPGPGMTTIDGHTAIEFGTPNSIRWRIGSVDYIEADWGPDAVDAEAQVRALVASLQSRYWPGSS
jgi:hypothetical protein